MKLKCIVIDDEPIARKIIHEFIEDIEFMELAGTADNPLKAIELMKKTEPDIIFLDINMPRINGIDFLKSTKTEATVIMTTAYPEHAVTAFGLDVLDYLVKPISFDRFFKACNKARELTDLRNKATSTQVLAADHFFIKCDNHLEKVFFNDLLYAEAMLNYVMLHTTSRKMMVYLTIKSLEEQLPADTFLKVHKSFIVNIGKIKSIEGNMIHIDEARIMISQNLREKVLKDILKDRIIKR